MQIIKSILMQRDGLSSSEADQMLIAAREDFNQRLDTGELPFDICEEWFGLEPDYMDELIN